MPLSEKIIEQLSREPSRTPGWSSRLLMFSGTIFFVSVFVYFGITYGYRPYLEREVARLNDQIKKFSEQISIDDQEKIIRFYSQSSNLKNLLDSHVLASPIFAWVEKNTQSNTFYNRFSLNTAVNQLALSGSARNATDVTQQMDIFQKQPEVERLNFNNLSIGPTGLWQFDLTLFLRPDFFVKPAEPASAIE